MRREHCHVEIFLGNVYLSISAVRVRCLTYRHVTKHVEIFVHAQYPAQILNRHCVQFPKIYAEAESAVFPLATARVGGAHSVQVGSIPSMASIQSTSIFLDSPFVVPARYRAECIGLKSFF